MGMSASMAAFLLCSGAKGKRFVLPNSEVMIHQPLGGAQGQATDIEIVAKNISRIKKNLYEIMAKNTGKEYQEIYDACERDNYLSAEEAVEFGLVDRILTPGGSLE
jgi:ATP-dependent Clp protease protease subunit